MYEQIPIEKVEPNSWNPNVMPPETQAKLENGMRQVLDQVGKLPPIVVRPKPGAKGKFEIIDGFHRWSILKKLKQPSIDAFVLDVSDDLARVLTATLNYIKGEADPEKYPMLIVEAMKANPKLELDDLAKLLPETEDMLQDMILASETASTALDAVLENREPTDAEVGEDDTDPERWVNLNFAVPLEVSGLIEAELDRIAERLTGKNRRTRALEFMAVLSSQTPLDELDKTVAAKAETAEEAAPVNASFESDVKAPTKPTKKAKTVEAELKQVSSKKPATAPKKPKAKA